MAERKIKVFVGRNFELEGISDMPTDESYLERSGAKFDSRLNFLTTDWDTSTFQWYYNYLATNQIIASRNPKAYCTYLLDIGYVPVIYLPSIAAELTPKFTQLLDNCGLPYIKMGATSFANKYCNIDTVDAWVSKMDAAKFLGCKPEDVRSADIFRRLVHE